MKYKLNSKNYNELDYDTVLYDLLKDRGIASPIEWLNPKQSYELNPFKMNYMKKGIELLCKYVKEKRKIQIIVDSDLDGYTSGALIVSFLTQVLNIEDGSFALHPGKEHGIVLKDIDDDAELIIVPDAGSSQKLEHIHLLEQGKALIILDHHESDNDLVYPEEYADRIVIINNQLDSYENKALSGAGVTLKFIQGYCSTYGIPFPQKYYSLAACGIVADVMDISVLENKYIVDSGIDYMPEHPFLYEFILKNCRNGKMNPKATVKDIGWSIGPHINAIIRLGTMEQKQTIFRAMVTPTSLVQTEKRGSDDMVPIYKEAVRLCENAKKRQSTALEKNIKLIQENMEISDDSNCIVYVDNDRELTFELSGLIANQLLSKYNRPVILLREFRDKKNKEYRGSVRGKPVDSMDNLKELMNGISGVNKAEGHAFAFGVNIDMENFEEFKAHLNATLDTIDFDVNLYFIDMESRYNLVNAEVAGLFAREDIWGHGVDKPQALLTDVPTDNYELMGDQQQHIKINCGKYDLLLFKEQELAESLSSGYKCHLDVIGEFSIDQTYNVGRLQFIVKDYDVKDYVEKTIYDFVF